MMEGTFKIRGNLKNKINLIRHENGTSGFEKNVAKKLFLLRGLKSAFDYFRMK